MLYESRKNRRRKSPMLMRGINSQPLRKRASKVRINPEIAIPKLKKLSKMYQNVSEVKGLLTDLRVALGMPNSKGASKYGFVKIRKGDKILECSIRLTNHNSNTATYVTQDANFEYNLSIVIRKRFRPYSFKPNDKVRLDEYVYYEERIREIENPLSKIIDELIHFIETGEYNEPTGVAFRNQSFKKEINTENKSNNENMKITKRELKQMINEAVVSAMVLDESRKGVFKYLEPKDYKEPYIMKHLDCRDVFDDPEKMEYVKAHPFSYKYVNPEVKAKAFEMMEKYRDKTIYEYMDGVFGQPTPDGWSMWDVTCLYNMLNGWDFRYRKH